MKTIMAIKDGKEFKSGEMRRVDDKTAFNMVGLSWKYIPKSEWKVSRGKKVVQETTEQVTAQPTEQVEKKPYKKGQMSEKHKNKD
jgi:hypothetical protein